MHNHGDAGSQGGEVFLREAKQRTSQVTCMQINIGIGGNDVLQAVGRAYSNTVNGSHLIMTVCFPKP